MRLHCVTCDFAIVIPEQFAVLALSEGEVRVDGKLLHACRATRERAFGTRMRATALRDQAESVRARARALTEDASDAIATSRQLRADGQRNRAGA